jgi:acylphosphatase
MGDLMKIKITITGKVHDVGYRPFLLDLADSLFIQRFDARNVVINGKQAVVVLVEGEEDQVNQFIKLVKSENPENAIVEEIKVEEYKGFVRSIDSYRQSLMVNQLNKIVQVGLKMLEKQDLMLQKQDLMLQKQDETLKEIRGMRVELKEEIRETREELKNEITKTRVELKEEIKGISSKLDKTNKLLEKRFERLEEEIERIKKALIKAGIEF